MSRKVFAAGEIQTAADSNEFLLDENVMSFADSTARGSAIGTAVQGMVTYLNDIDSLSVYNANDWTVDRTIQVFADSTARGSAIGTAVEGMASWLEDSKRLSVYNGSSWQPVGVEPNVVFIGSETFSAVASASIDNVFSSDYTSYKAVVNVLASSVDDEAFRLRVRASGSTLTTLVYEHGRFTVGSRSASTVTSINSQNANHIVIGNLSSLVGYSVEITFHNPFTLSNTRVVQIGSGRTLDFVGGIVNDSLAYDGFIVQPDTGTITGRIDVYGIVES
jgi:hypothetical protein